MTHLEPFFMKAIKFYLQHQTNNTATKVYEDMGRRFWGGGGGRRKLRELRMLNLIILRSNP